MLAVAESPASYSEIALAALWSRAHMLADALISEAGERLRVIYPGRPSSLAGPDFRDAVLLTESGDTVHGDIELHTSAPGWYSHGHHSDANYNGVVLHVVFSPKGHTETRQQSSTGAAIVSLKPVALDLEQAGNERAPSLPALDALQSATDMGEVLDAAGDARFLAKSHGFAIELSSIGLDETLYRGVMEALGYSTNRKPFRTLAGRVPYATLATLRDEPSSTSLLAAKAVLLGASGLLHLVDDSEDPALLRRLYRQMPRVRSMKKDDWRLFRVRPANHPVRRIIGAAQLVQESLESGFGETALVDLRTGGHRNVLARLERPSQIGTSRARDILVNVVLPCLHAFADVFDDQELREAARVAYDQAPRLQENEVTREMRRLGGIGRTLKISARRQQGLIHLYKTAVQRTHT